LHLLFSSLRKVQCLRWTTLSPNNIILVAYRIGWVSDVTFPVRSVISIAATADPATCKPASRTAFVCLDSPENCAPKVKANVENVTTTEPATSTKTILTDANASQSKLD
jgi:hypothetical protein